MSSIIDIKEMQYEPHMNMSNQPTSKKILSDKAKKIIYWFSKKKCYEK